MHYFLLFPLKKILTPNIFILCFMHHFLFPTEKLHRRRHHGPAAEQEDDPRYHGHHQTPLEPWNQKPGGFRDAVPL